MKFNLKQSNSENFFHFSGYMRLSIFKTECTPKFFPNYNLVYDTFPLKISPFLIPKSFQNSVMLLIYMQFTSDVNVFY